MKDANGNVYEYEYDGNGNVTEIHNPDGGVEVYVYDTNDQLISKTDGEGYETTYVYDENGNLIQVTDPRGNSKFYEYDAINQQVKTINEESGVVELTYDPLGRVIKAVNEDGAVTEYEYDAKGRNTSIKDAHGNYKYMEYDPMDRVTAITDENGVRRTYEYDAKGNLVKYTDGLGHSETYTYDANGNRLTLTDRNGNTYKYTYDPLNRVVSETDPKGNIKTFTYDKNSRITAVTDRNGNTTKYVLDGNGNIVKSIDAQGTESIFEYDSMDRLVKIRLHRIDPVHEVDEWQETLYTYDHRGLVKTEVNAKGDGKVFVYDGNGNLISKTDEDGYVTEYAYSPVNLVSEINYADGKTASYLYDGTGDLIKMDDWNGTTTISRDLLNRITNVNDHEGRDTGYGWDNVGNKTVQGYPDGTQVDYYYDAENRLVEMVDFDQGVSKFTYDANGNMLTKEYPNYETAYYTYDACNLPIEMDEYDLGGKKLFKTIYEWDAEGNLLTDNRYNHGQSSKVETEALEEGSDILAPSLTDELEETEPATEPNLIQRLFNIEPDAIIPDPLENTAAGVILDAIEDQTKSANEEIIAQAQEEAEPPAASEPETPEPAEPASSEPEEPAATDPPADEESSKPETGKEDATIEGNGDGNGQVPPGQTEDEDGNIVNPGGNVAPGLNRGEKPDKPDNPNKPEKPEKPGKPDKDDESLGKAQKGTHEYTYDSLNRVISSNVSKVVTKYTYDTLGNLVLEKSKNYVVDYQYNELNQLVRRESKNKVSTYEYDKRGNRIAEHGKKENREFVYDATNRLVEGTNWKGDKSAYTYNGLGLRINNTQTTHSGQVYARDYVIDYTSPENNDLMVYGTGSGKLSYTQKHTYTDQGQRMEQFTDAASGGYVRMLYVHEDLMGSTRYFTKATGQSFAELDYDAWGAPTSPNKLVNNDHGNYVFATYTGHIYDTVLDIYFAEARFYDAANRTWMAVDPVKDGLNWYQYAGSNPTTYWDPTGLWFEEKAASYHEKLSGSDSLSTVETLLLPMELMVSIRFDGMVDVLQNVLSFLSGALLAVTEDIGSPIRMIWDLIHSSSQTNTTGLEPLGPLEDISDTPIYNAPFEKQNAFSAGRIVGHVISSVIGIAEYAFGSVVSGGSVVFTIGSGGTASAISIPGIVFGSAIATAGMVTTTTSIAAIANDPNIQFSMGSEGDSHSNLGNYEFKEGIDEDLRGGKGTFEEALEKAFEKTGTPKEDFTVTKWGKDQYGKSHPVEWRASNGAEVSVDIGHSVKSGAPTADHVGWQTGGKRSSGGGVRGHIFVDEVPYNR